MAARFFNMFFGCWHSHYSFPITVRAGARRKGAAGLTGTYVVCLDCGREFPYDWQEMKVITHAPEKGRAVGSLATKEAA
jgi:hypothetical protein